MNSDQRRAVFLDKDGTLVHNLPYNVDATRLRFEAGALEGVRALQQLGYLVVIVTNQSGVALGYFSEDDLRTLREALEGRLREAGIRLDGFYYCPHHPQGRVDRYTGYCNCRKPRSGLLLRAAHALDIDLSRSWMIGDILHDVEAGHGAGCRALLVDNGHETAWNLRGARQPDFVVGDLREAAALIALEEKENECSRKT